MDIELPSSTDDIGVRSSSPTFAYSPAKPTPTAPLSKQNDILLTPDTVEMFSRLLNDALSDGRSTVNEAYKWLMSPESCDGSVLILTNGEEAVRNVLKSRLELLSDLSSSPDKENAGNHTGDAVHNLITEEPHDSNEKSKCYPEPLEKPALHDNRNLISPSW